MKQINDYFEKIEALFLEKDKEAFREIKEDIEREIEERLAEGEDIETILSSLGTPEDIAASYYEDKRLDKAMKANQDVIDRDELVEEYKLKRKEDLAIRKRKIKVALLIMLRSILVLLVLLLLLVTVVDLIEEQTLVWGPIMTSLFLGSLLFLFSNNDCKRNYGWLIRLLCLFSLLGSIVLVLRNSWFYSGQLYKETLPIDVSSLDKMKIEGNIPVDISVIHISKNEDPKIEVIGHLTKKDQKKLLKTTRDSVKLTVGEDSLLSWTTRMEPVEIILYLPEEVAQKKLVFQVNKGDINLDHMDVEKLSVSMNEGEFRLTNVNSASMTLNSKNANILVRHFFSNIVINNDNGKSIVSDGQGDVQTKSLNGLINISAVSGKKTSINNDRGKIIVSSGTIQQLDIENEEGTTVIDAQEGTTKIKNGEGKVVLTDLKYALSLTSKSGTIIMNEQYPLNTTIKSDAGDVKWVQTVGADIKFDLNSNVGKIQNTFKSKEKASHQVMIQTNTGDIKVISND